MSGTINFSDVFKSSTLDKISDVSWFDMGLTMLLAFVLGLFILYVYRKTFKGVMVSRSFGVSLMALTLITSLIIMAITSNIILSLGMVGALSIVRFRSAIKEPMDIAFLFWSISVGIVVGAGLIPMAIFGSLFIGLVLILFARGQGVDAPYLLVVRCGDEAAEKQVMGVVTESVKRCVVKSKTVSAKGIEMTVEVRIAGGTTKFVNDVAAVSGVENAVMVSYNGEYSA